MSETQSRGGWPQPYRLPDAEPYWQSLGQEQLTYQHCAACEQAVWPPHSHCPHCGARSLAWKESRGRGTVYSFSAVMRGPTPVWAAIVPYTVGFVQMEEGYCLFTQIDAPAESIRIGQPVRVRYVQRGGQVLPVFVPEA